MANTFTPPQNYIKTDSKIEGIQIYKPAPQEQKIIADVLFKCPQCGANTAYSVEDGGLVCTYCGYYEKPKAQQVGTRAEQFEFKVETLDRFAQGWGEERKELSCQSCGAVVTIPPNSLSVTCAFCGSNKVVQTQASQSDIRPRYVIPFRLEQISTRKIAKEWLGSSWMVPASLKESSLIKDINPIYLPYWTFDSSCSAEWKAEVGHTVTERYYSDGEWKTRTRTEWRWESGSVQTSFDDLVVEGTNRLSQRHLKAIAEFDMHQLTEYDPKYLAGMFAKTYDIPLEKAWETARERMRENTRQECISQASTSQVRNFTMSLDFSDETWRYILLPVYLMAYRFNNQVYQMLINGQTGTISGQRPVDWQKIWVVIALCLLPGVALGLLGLLTLLLGGIGAVIGGFGFFLLIIGLVISIVILVKANSMDDL
jgi:DNA-directed RNA polymerase subunit RPC12/RpoP